MTRAPSRANTLGWTAVWVGLFLVARPVDMDRFASWLDEPVWIAWILVGFYLLYLTFRWFSHRA